MQSTLDAGETPAVSILIVEDEGIIASNIGSNLRRAGYGIAGMASCAEEAFEILSRSRPELMLIDIHLSGSMDGIELARRFHEQFGIPFIYLTAHSNSETLERARETGPSGYLIKPVQQNSLLRFIEDTLLKQRVEGGLQMTPLSDRQLVGQSTDMPA